MTDFSANLQRIMARLGLNVQDVAVRSGMDQRTIKSILNGHKTKSHARTLHRLASGLGVAADEFFQNPSLLAHRSLEREPHPVLCELLSTHPDLFEGWSLDDFDRLHKQVEVGTHTTRNRAIEVVRTVNRKREFFRKIDVILESDQADVLAGIVDLLFAKLDPKKP